MTVKRAFAEIAEGQVHYWHGAPAHLRLSDAPLVFLHPGPGTARHQVPLLNLFARHIRVIAPDLMGMGDSVPAAPEAPELDYFADAAFRFLDSLGVESCHLMGSSLGGRVAVEMALQKPARVKKLVLNRIMMIAGENLTEMKAKHAPQVLPDQTGAYLWFVWNRLRNLAIYFPWFKTDAAHMRKVDLPSAENMHVSLVEHLKMCATSHKAFTAYWNYPIAEKLRLVKVPTMCRAETAAFVPGATPWTPVFEGDPLGAKPEALQGLIEPVVNFLKS
ncbi:MAG: alpha/beta fold hydrolase [Rhodospirillaceae bacterium]|nr:alpha/beta fold hydrolase [Rhodospirillaceae bacterium]